MSVAREAGVSEVPKAPLEGEATAIDDDVKGLVQFCPHCGAELDVQSFVQEYWTADARLFHVWCERCRHVFDVRPTARVTTHEPAHE
jgi:hypothetical protein